MQDADFNSRAGSRKQAEYPEEEDIETSMITSEEPLLLPNSHQHQTANFSSILLFYLYLGHFLARWGARFYFLFFLLICMFFFWLCCAMYNLI